MNLIINPNPKDDQHSLSGALSQRLARHLGGVTRVIRIYDTNQKYFNYVCNQEWINAVIEAKRIILPIQMWNFSIPAALKDFFDKITKQGQLWEMGPNNNFVGLLTDRPVFVIMTSGLIYPLGSRQDFVVPYLKVFFEFLGIKDVRDFRLGNVMGSAKLVADPKYMEKQTRAMLKSFGLNPNQTPEV